MLSHAYKQKIIKIPTKRSAYGDIIVDTADHRQVFFARFRVITNVMKVNNRDELRSDDAQMWCEPGTNIGQFDIVLAENQYWQVTKINEARRMAGTAVQFLKCSLSAYQVVS